MVRLVPSPNPSSIQSQSPAGEAAGWEEFRSGSGSRSGTPDNAQPWRLESVLHEFELQQRMGEHEQALKQLDDEGSVTCCILFFSSLHVGPHAVSTLAFTHKNT